MLSDKESICSTIFHKNMCFFRYTYFIALFQFLANLPKEKIQVLFVYLYFVAYLCIKWIASSRTNHIEAIFNIFSISSVSWALPAMSFLHFGHACSFKKYSLQKFSSQESTILICQIKNEQKFDTRMLGLHDPHTKWPLVHWKIWAGGTIVSRHTWIIELL